MVSYVKHQNSKKTNKNHMFSTFDVMSVLFSLAVVVSISVTLFFRTVDRKKADLAKINMENLAHELSEKSVIYSQENKSRIPASAENIGKDPWGNDYSYKVVRNSYGQPVYLILLSSGPDSKFDTAINSHINYEDSQIESIKFLNDDIGYVRSFR